VEYRYGDSNPGFRTENPKQHFRSLAAFAPSGTQRCSEDFLIRILGISDRVNGVVMNNLRALINRWKVSAAAIVCTCLICCGAALAASQPPEMKVSIGLSSKPGAKIAASVLFKLAAFPPGSTGLPPVRTLRLSADLGSMNLRGVPTCRPKPGSSTSGCSAPAIGSGRVFAYQQYEAEGDIATKRHGTIELYRVHMQGAEAKLRSFVISMTVKRMSAGAGELRVPLPKLEGGRLTIAELLLTLHRKVLVDGRSVVVDQVTCPTSAVVEAEALFYIGAASSAQGEPGCSS
jgi:hypothetical protein